MDPEKLRALLAVLVEAAPKLREAGVTQVEHEGLKVTFAPMLLVGPRPAPVHNERDAALQALVDLSAQRGMTTR